MSDLSVLRAMHELPAISFFCKSFEKDLHLKSFDIEDLENGLTDPNKNNFIAELHIKFLQGLSKQKPNSINMDTWEQVLKSEINKKRKLYFYFFISNPMEHGSYRSIDLRCKILILKGLCDWKLEESENLSVKMRDESFATNLRLIPIGKDSKNNSYYYFDDLRLYKEAEVVAHPHSPSPPSPPSPPPHQKKRGRKPKVVEESENEEDESSSDKSESEDGSDSGVEGKTKKKSKEEFIDRDSEEESSGENRRVTRSRSSLVGDTTNNNSKSHNKKLTPKKSPGRPRINKIIQKPEEPSSGSSSSSSSSEEDSDESEESEENEKSEDSEPQIRVTRSRVAKERDLSKNRTSSDLQKGIKPKQELKKGQKKNSQKDLKKGPKKETKAASKESKKESPEESPEIDESNETTTETESTGSIKSTKSTDSIEPTKSTDSIESTEPNETVEAMDTTDSTDTAEIITETNMESSTPEIEDNKNTNEHNNHTENKNTESEINANGESKNMEGKSKNAEQSLVDRNAGGKENERDERDDRGDRDDRDESENESTSDKDEDKENSSSPKNIIVLSDDHIGAPKWELVCASLVEWESLMDGFASSRHKEEQLLLNRVEEDIFPYVSNKFHVLARQRAKMEVQQPIKRSSRLQEREKEKLEAVRLLQERKAKLKEENKQNQNEEQERNANARAERLNARANKRRKLNDSEEAFDVMRHLRKAVVMKFNQKTQRW